MIRPLGAKSLGDGSVDIDGDGQGDYCPTGDCDYDSPDKDTSEDLKNTAKALEILSKLIDFLKNLLKFSADSKLQKQLKDAEKKLNEGKQKMMDEANKLNSNFENLQISNQNLQTQLGDLTNVTDSISSQLSTLTSLTSSINGLDATMASQSLAIAESQARLDQALNRANYPIGIDGLRQQRADIRSANFDVMTNSLALNNSGGLKGGKRILFCFGGIRFQLVQQALSLYAREQKNRRNVHPSFCAHAS